MAKKTPPKRDPFVTRAAVATAVRFGPQESAILGLLREAQARRDQGVRAAKSTAAGTISVIEKAQPQLQQTYKDAGFSGAPVPEVALPAGPASFASAQAFEQAGAQRSIGRQAAAAIGGLQQQKVLAQQGATFGALQAERQYGDDRQQIGAKAQSLQDQKGAYGSQVLLGLVDDANDRRALDRRQERSLASQDRRARSSQQAAAAGREDQQAFQAGQNQKSRDAAAANAATRQAAKAAKPVNTPKQIAAANDAFTKSRVQATTYKVGFKAGQWRQLAQFLITQKNVNATIAVASAQLALNGGSIDLATRRRLLKRGIKYPKPPAPLTPAQAAHRVVRGLGLPG